MNSLLSLIKTGLISNFPFINKLIVKKETKSYAACLLALVIYIIFIGFLVIYLSSFSSIFKMVNQDEVVLIMGISLGTVLTFITNIARSNAYIFKCKDYELLMAMPISYKDIVISKLIVLYLSNLLFMFAIVIASFICFTLATSFNVVYLLSSIVIGLISPIIPIVVSSLLAFVLGYIPINKKLKNIFSIILYLGLLLVLILAYNQIVKLESGDLLTQVTTIKNAFINIYPLSKVFYEGFYLGNILNIIIILISTIIISLVFIYLISKNFRKYNSRKQTSKKTNKEIIVKTKSEIKTLLSKELRTYINIPSYVINTITGPILSIVACILLSLHMAKNNYSLGNPTIDKFLSKEFVCVVIVLVCGVMQSMANTTSTSISIEGKNFWIIKSSPTSVEKIFMSKILFGFILFGISSMICSICAIIILKPSFLISVLMIISMLTISFTYQVIGLYINLLLPKLNFINPIQVIKQSASVLANMIVLFVISIIIFIIVILTSLVFSSLYVLLFLLLIIVILLAISLVVLLTDGKKRYNKL